MKLVVILLVAVLLGLWVASVVLTWRIFVSRATHEARSQSWRLFWMVGAATAVIGVATIIAMNVGIDTPTHR